MTETWTPDQVSLLRRLNAEGESHGAIAKKTGHTRHGVRHKLAEIAREASSPRSVRPITLITVGMRHRKDLGDIEGLAKSIRQNGLLHPIVIRADGTLIAGARRLAACHMLGMTDVPVHIIDLDEIIRGELAENTDRKDFLPSEIDAIRRAIEPVEKAAAKERQREHGGTAPGKHSGKISTSDNGKTRDKIGAFAGVSGRTVEKIAAVVQAAESEPEKYGKLAADMDRTGRVNGPFKRLQVIRQSEALRISPPPMPMRGPYHCLVVDFPWPHEPDDEDPGERGRATRPYTAMSLAQGRTMAVPSILAEDSMVWMWVTNFHMRYAFEILDAWGLRATPTILTWVKDKMGRGQILRDKTEHCIIATRGKPIFNLSNETTELRAPRRENSRKPDEFYALVEKLCPAPIYAELFSRGGRGPNWDCHGDEVGKFAAAVDPPAIIAAAIPEAEPPATIGPAPSSSWDTLEIPDCLLRRPADDLEKAT